MLEGVGIDCEGVSAVVLCAQVRVEGGAAVITNRTSRILGDKRMSVRELARGAGISYGAAYGLYSGQSKRYDDDVLNRVCNFLGVGLCDLLEYTPDAPHGREGEGDA